MAKEMKKYTGTGHRKTSVARVTLTPGTGKITVNGRDVREYFPSEICVMDLSLIKNKSIKYSHKINKIDV